jgi:hypothetical protein
MTSRKIDSLTSNRTRGQIRILRACKKTAEKPLPGADRLWELLDRNICIAVWENAHN